MSFTRIRLAAVILLAALSIVPALVPSASYATKYGAGSYGRCQYATCAISLSSSSTVNVNVTPAAGSTKCTVAKDSVTVTTSSSTGYTLTLIDNDTTNTLTAGANTIAPTSGTYASPAALSAGSWGYRVDGAGSFGAGPTNAVASGAVPALTFAKLQPSSGTADTIVNVATAAANGVTTGVWYGVCVGAGQPSGTYSDSILYTSIVN